MLQHHSNAGRRAQAQCEQRAVWAYLHDPSATDGPCRLLEQKAAVDALAAGASLAIERYIIDSGSKASVEGRGAGLERAIAQARATGRTVVLLVPRPGLLAIRSEDMLQAVADLLDAGFVLKDASGELHPTHGTIALARDVSRSLRRVNRSVALSRLKPQAGRSMGCSE